MTFVTKHFSLSSPFLFFPSSRSAFLFVFSYFFTRNKKKNPASPFRRGQTLPGPWQIEINTFLPFLASPSRISLDFHPERHFHHRLSIVWKNIYSGEFSLFFLFGGKTKNHLTIFTWVWEFFPQIFHTPLLDLTFFFCRASLGKFIVVSNLCCFQLAWHSPGGT